MDIQKRESPVQGKILFFIDLYTRTASHCSPSCSSSAWCRATSSAVKFVWSLAWQNCAKVCSHARSAPLSSASERKPTVAASCRVSTARRYALSGGNVGGGREWEEEDHEK